MELRGVELALLVSDDSDRRVGRGADGGETFRQLRNAVAVTHPHRVALADFPDAIGERRRFCYLDFGTAKFPVMPGLDFAAELVRHGLFAITDAKHRHSSLIDRHRREGGTLVEHASWPA